jgi:hypothetical protein
MTEQYNPWIPQENMFAIFPWALFITVAGGITRGINKQNAKYVL